MFDLPGVEFVRRLARTNVKVDSSRRTDGVTTCSETGDPVRQKRELGMGRGKSADTPAAQARRMPFVAKIKRQDPFCPNDAQEINAMCRRIAASSEYLARAGWRENADFRVYRFTTCAKARAMQYWIDRSGIAHRPMPKLGMTPEEIAETKRQALAWGLATGGEREYVQAYRRARHAGEAELTSFNGTSTIAMALGRPTGHAHWWIRPNRE